MASPNLGIPAVQDSNTPEVEVNAAVDLLDQAMNDTVSIAITTDTAITAVQFNQNIELNLTGTPGLPFDIFLPTNKRLFIANNGADDAATVGVDDGIGGFLGSTVVLLSGSRAILYSDGVNVEKVGGSSVGVSDDSLSIVAEASVLNFTGAGVTVTDGGGGQADIAIPGGGGGGTGVTLESSPLRFIATRTFSAVSQLDIEDFANGNDYKELIFKVRHLSVSVDDVGIRARFKLNGTYKAGASTYALNVNASDTASAVSDLGFGFTLDQGTIGPAASTWGVGNAANEYKSGTMSMIDPLGPNVKRLMYEMRNTRPSGAQTQEDGTVIYNGVDFASPLEGLRIFPSSGTMSGVIDVYGVLAEAADIPSSLQSIAVATRPKHKGAKVVKGTLQTITTATPTKVVWDAADVVYDTDTLFSDAADGFVVPDTARKMRFKAQIDWATNNTGDRTILIHVDGVAVAGTGQDVRNAADSTTANIDTGVIAVTPGETVTVNVTQDSGGNLDIDAVAQTWFEAEVVEEIGATTVPTGFIAVQPRTKGALVKIDVDQAFGAAAFDSISWESAVYQNTFNGLKFWLGPDLAFTTDFATDNNLDATAHGMSTGDGPLRVSSTTTLPAGLSAATNYWVVRISDNEIQLATSYANALAGTEVTLTDNGTGTHTLLRADWLVIPGAAGDITQVELAGAFLTVAAETDLKIGAIKKNGVGVPGLPRNAQTTGANVGSMDLKSSVIDVTAGDRFNLEAFVGTAGDFDAADGDGYGTWFSIDVIEEGSALTFPGVTVERPHIGAFVTQSASQTGLAASTNNPIAFNTEQYDTGYRGVGFHDNVTNNSRITIPAGVTKVQLFAGLGLTGLGAASSTIRFWRNGANIVNADVVTRDESTATSRFHVLHSQVLEVTPGDYFELIDFHGAGTAATANAQTWFQMTVVETEEAAFPPEPIETPVLAVGAALAINTIYYKKVSTRRFSLFDEFSGSQGHAGTAPTGTSQVFDVKKNGTTIGTVTFAVGSQTATFTTTGGTEETFDVGDVLTVETQGTVNTVIRDIVIALWGWRS